MFGVKSMASILQIPCIPENFAHLADRILNYTLLMINGHPHRICEIEFYLNSPTHSDAYVHTNEDQTKKGTWYFHRYNNGTYKNGTFKGLDIVLNSGINLENKERIYASALIRTIIDINQRKIIEGPCLVVNHILALYRLDNIMMLTGGNSLNFMKNNHNLILVEGNPSVLEPILYGPRIGLSDKYLEYRTKYYRFVIGPIKKQRKTLTYVQ
jgi:hypothetical protein